MKEHYESFDMHVSFVCIRNWQANL